MHVKHIIPILMLLAMAGCNKDIDVFEPYPTAHQLLFTASAFVEVVDEHGVAQENATVRIGNKQLTTNDDGFVFFQDVLMSGQSYVTIDKPGFFHGSRRFYPSVNATHFLNVTLLSSQPVGSFNSGTGGQISLDGDARLSFPAEAIVDPNGELYTGTVDVSAQPIYADDPELSSKMPGDLVGMNGSNELGSLASLGMMAVELRSSSGDLLQVKEGSTVEMHMPIPSDMIANAPTTIPMWYFDEVEGLWIEEGTANRSGDAYVAEVGHFTYWNYDAWFPIVKWGATFLLPNGEPASNVSVCLTILSLEATKCASTIEDGVVCGMVAEGEPLLMEVKDPCGNVIYADEIGPYYDSTMIGPITIDAGGITINTISGSAVNCDSEPVTDGFVVVKIGDNNHYSQLDEADGSFSLNVINCNSNDAVITVFDEEALKQSLPLTFPDAPEINTGEITVCEVLQEFIILTVEGNDIYFLNPDASILEDTWTQIVSGDSLKYFYVSFEGTSEGTYNTSIISETSFEAMPGVFGYLFGIELVISYYGNPGDYIVGTLIATFKEHQGTGEYPVTGEFSVKLE